MKPQTPSIVIAEPTRRLAWIATPLGALPFAGCARAPSLDVLGSFFPVWMPCIAAGLLLTVGARVVFVRTDLEPELGPLVVVYPALAALFSCAIWLIWFGV